jgi:hypothetical protein
MNTDPFHRKAIKQFDRPLYESLRGYSKRASLDVAVESLLGYSCEHKTFASISSDPRALSAYKHAVRLTRAKFIPHQPLVRLSLANATDRIPKNTSAGFSFPGKKKGEVIQDIFDVASYMQHFIQKDRFVYVPPCKLALRGHLHDLEKPKTRAVWVYPAEVICLEAKWSIPYGAWITTQNDLMFNGRDALHRVVEHVNKFAGPHYRKLILDWSKFDQSVPQFIIEDVFRILQDSFDDRYVDHDDYTIFQGEVGARQSRNLWRFLETYFTRTKLMLPDGTVIRKMHGVPSGSGFTAIVDTIANHLMCHFLLHILDMPVPIYEHYLGDDAELIFHSFAAVEHRDLAKVSDAADVFLGMTLHPEKVTITDKVEDHKVIGYNVARQCLTRRDESGDPDREWFKLLLYAESDVQDLATAGSRLYAYYLLGGSGSVKFSRYYKYFIGVYPILIDYELPFTSGAQRSVRAITQVMGSELFHFKKLNTIDPFREPWLLTQF